MTEASIAGTYVCPDKDGNEVYTDLNRPGCREFMPKPPNHIKGTAPAKIPQAPQKRLPSVPVPSTLPGDQKRDAQDLLRAVASGNKEKTELVLRGGISANAKDERGQSALTMAAALPSTDIAALLLAHGADANARSNDGATPLMAALMAGRKDTAKLLSRKGADVNALVPIGSPTPQQMPMLFLAIAIGDVEITKLLIEEGADVNATLSDGQQRLSPLAFAHNTNQRDIAELLNAPRGRTAPLEAHIRQLEDRLTSLCKDAGEKIYEVIENVEGIYIHLEERNADTAFGYYHEKDRLSSTYLSPTRGANYRFWEMDALGKAGVINHHGIEAYALGKIGDETIYLKQVARPVAAYGFTWRPLTGTEDQRQGVYGEELKIFEVRTARVLAVRTVFFYAITDTTVNASGEPLPIPGGHKPYRFGTCLNYSPGHDYAYADLRPRDSYRFVSKVLRPKPLAY